MSDNKKKGQFPPTVEGLFALYRKNFPDDYPKLLSIYEKDGEQKAIEEATKKIAGLPDPEKFPIQPTGSALSELLKPTIALPEGTAVPKGTLEGQKLPTYSEEEQKQIFSQLKKDAEEEAPEDILYRTQRDLTRIQVEKEKEARDYDVLEALDLGRKNVIKTVIETAVGAGEGLGLILSQYISQNVDYLAGQDLFSFIHKGADLVRAYTKVKYGITDKDELIMENSFDQQVINGLTQAGLFMLATGVGGGVAGTAGQIAGGALVSSVEATQEATQAYDATKSLDTAFQTFVANLPATALDYATDRFVFFKGLGTGNINKVLGLFAEMGVKGFMEGGTELLQQYWQNITARELYDYNRSLLAGLDESFRVGSFIGFFLGGATTMTEMMLQRNLTAEERMLLEEQRKQLYDTSTKLLSFKDLDNKVKQWKEENTILRVDPVSFKKSMEEVTRSAREESTQGVVNLKGETVAPNAGTSLIQRGRVKFEQAQNTIDKASGIAMQTIGSLMQSANIDEMPTIQVPEQYKPLVEGIKNLSKTALGAGFLYWLGQTDFINDPTVIGALMLPVARMNLAPALKKFSLFQTMTKEGVGVEALDMSRVPIKWNKLLELPAGERIPLSRLLGKDLLKAIPEIKSANEGEFTLEKSTDSRMQGVFGAYKPSSHEIVLYPKIFDENVPRRNRIDDITKRLKELYTVEERQTKFPIITRWLENLDDKKLRDTHLATVVLHEFQHLVDDLTPELSTGGAEETWLTMPSQVINQFFLDNPEIVEAAIIAIKNDNASIGNALQNALQQLFGDSEIKYSQVHNKINELFDNIIRPLRTEVYEDEEIMLSEQANEKLRFILYDMWVMFGLGEAQSLLRRLDGLDETISGLVYLLEQYQDAVISGTSRTNLATMQNEIRRTRDAILSSYGEIYDNFVNLFEKMHTSYYTNRIAIARAERLWQNRASLPNFGKDLLIELLGATTEMPSVGVLQYRIYRSIQGERRARTTEALFIENLVLGATGTNLPISEKAPEVYAGEKGGIITNKEQVFGLEGLRERARTFAKIDDAIIGALQKVRDMLELSGYDLERFDNIYGDDLELASEEDTDTEENRGYYAVVRDQESSIGKSIFNMANYQQSIPEIKQRNARIQMATQIAKILANEGVEVPPIGDIYVYLEQTGRDILPPAEDLPNIVQEIRKLIATREPQTNVIALTHFADLVGEQDGDIDEIILDPQEAWKHPHTYSEASRKIKTPRVFFYPIFDIEQYRNGLEVRIAKPSKTILQTFVKPDELYFVDNEWNLPVQSNPMRLDFDTLENIEASFKFINELGYKGAVIEAGGKPVVVMFEPIKAYKAPTVRVGITAHQGRAINQEITDASSQFSNAYAQGEIDTRSLNTIVEATEQQLRGNLYQGGKLYGKVDKISPAIAVFGTAEASTVTTVTADIANLPLALERILTTGEQLRQDAVHIFVEGQKPANVNYGEVLPDYSQWQPMVTVKLPNIGYGDVPKIVQAFNDAGFFGATVSPTEQVAYIYNVEGDANGFAENASKLAERIKQDFPDAETTVTDIQLWSVGNAGAWGTVATYEEIKSILPTSKGQEITANIIDNIYGITPTLANLVTGQWDDSFKQAKERFNEFLEKKNLSADDASKLMAKVAVGNALANNTTVIDELQDLVKRNSWLLPISREAFGYSRELTSGYEGLVTLNEARAINNILSDFYGNPRDISEKVGGVLVTTDRAQAVEHGKSLLIKKTRPLDVKSDKMFLTEVEELLRDKFGDVAVNRVLKEKADAPLAEALEYAGLKLSYGNPAYLIDNLALKHIGRTASTYNTSLTFIQKFGDNVVKTPVNLSYNLEGIMKAKADNNPYTVLELLFALNNKQAIGNVKLDEDVNFADLNLSDKQVLNLWEKLTDGIVDPNKLLDISSIIGGLLKLTWNLIKLGFNTTKTLALKLGDFIGDKGKVVANILLAPIRRAILKEKVRSSQKVNLDEILPEYDARRLHRGVKEGATIGYKEENLAQPIRDNLDRIVEAVNEQLAKQKRYRIPVDIAKQTALRLLESGDVKAEDIDGFKRGTVLPPEYVMAYNIMAQNNLASSLDGFVKLKQKYGSIADIPSDLFDQAIANLQVDVSRWAKTRALISEAGRTVRLATEQFDNYMDIIRELADKIGIDGRLLNAIEQTEDKSIDWFGLILYNFALSNPLTHLANFFGNTFNLILNIVPEGIGNPTAFIDAFKALPAAILKAKNDIQGILTGTETEVTKFYEMQGAREQSVKEGLWKLFLPTTWLSISDAVFRNYGTEYKLRRLGRVLEQNIQGLKDGFELLRQLAIDPDEVLDRLTPEEADLALQAFEYADYWGKYVTYMLPPESNIGKAFVALSQHPITRMLILFAKTPLNILKQGMHYTPFYASKLLLEDIKDRKEGKERSAVDKVRERDRLRRIYTGTIIGGMLMQGMMSGLLHITGDEPDDEFERELWAKRGFKPYHIYIKSGDEWKGFSYVAFEPIRMTVNLYRGIYELYLDPEKYKYVSDNDILAKTSFLMNELWNNINDASFMTGINEWYRTQESPKSASEYLERLVANLLIPNAFTFQRELPEEIRDALNLRGKELYITENVWERIRAKVGFGLQEGLTPRYDFFGDKIYNKFERFPFTTTETGKDQDDKLLDWLDKHRLVVPSYKKDPVIDSYGDYPALKERISAKIGQRLRQGVREIMDLYSDFEEEYDAMKERARKLYGDDERVELFKTMGQIRLDEKIQERITRVYERVKKEVLYEELDIEVRSDLQEQMKTLEEEQIPEIELDKYSDKILEIELDRKNPYINNQKGEEQ